jgi:hypothetical protein
MQKNFKVESELKRPDVDGDDPKADDPKTVRFDSTADNADNADRDDPTSVDPDVIFAQPPSETDHRHKVHVKMAFRISDPIDFMENCPPTRLDEILRTLTYKAVKTVTWGTEVRKCVVVGKELCSASW